MYCRANFSLRRCRRYNASIVKGTAMALIQALNVYPVKSCRGIALDRASVTRMGFEHDREWMIVRAGGHFVTQREEPRLALIEPAFVGDSLQLSAPGVGSIRVALNHEGENLEVTCWRDRCSAFDAGSEVAAWLSDYLGKASRLVRFDSRRKRTSSTAWTGEVEALNQFSDGFPWLVVSQASLDELNTRLPEPLPMNRFRPNIVIEQVPAYAEDRIHEIIVGAIRLRVVKPCTRCAITTTDQSTGVRSNDQPLRTLKQYRFSAELKGVQFAQNAILISGVGETLQTRQEIEISWKSEAPGEPARA
jgi:uncharacterized protein YcbX